MGSNKQNEIKIDLINKIIKEKNISIDTVTIKDTVDDLLESKFVVQEDGQYSVTEKGKQWKDFIEFKEQKHKKEEELNTAIIESKSLKILSLLKEDSGSEIVTDDTETYNALKFLIKEGYANYENIGGIKHYTITNEGSDFLSFKEFQLAKDEENEIKIRESYITVTYKQAHPTMDLIESVTDKFLLESDGIPVIQVEPANYKKILDRKYNEHWHKYVGVGGGKLIKQKKLNRFYVENTENKRRYLYLVPKAK